MIQYIFQTLIYFSIITKMIQYIFQLLHHGVLFFASPDSDKLTKGDKAAIALGVIVAVLLALLAAFAFIRYRTNNGVVFRRSILRRQISRAKNFENSLYEETRKDTLTGRERVDTLAVETLSLGGPETWSDHRSPVSATVAGGHSGRSGQGQAARPGVIHLGHSGLEESNTDSQDNGGLWMSMNGQDDKVQGANGAINFSVVKNEVDTIQMDELPDQRPSLLESQA